MPDSDAKSSLATVSDAKMLENAVSAMLQDTVRSLLFAKADAFPSQVNAYIPEGRDESNVRPAQRQNHAYVRSANAKQRRVLIRQYKSLRKELMGGRGFSAELQNYGGNVSPPTPTPAQNDANDTQETREKLFFSKASLKASKMRSPKKIGRVKASASAGRNEKSKQEEVQILEYHALKSSIRNSAAVSIQKLWRGHHQRRPLTARHMKQTPAQVLWNEIEEERRRCDRALPYTDWGLDVLLQEKKLVKMCLAKKHVMLAKKLGRTPLKEDKEVFRGVYEYYHALKDHIEKLRQEKALTKSTDGPLSTVALDESLDLQQLEVTIASDLFDTSTDADTFVSPTASSHPFPSKTPLEQLSAEYLALKNAKRVLQRKLTSYEKHFERVKGRKIKFSHDIEPLRAEWEQYKKIKEDLQDPRFHQLTSAATATSSDTKKAGSDVNSAQ